MRTIKLSPLIRAITTISAVAALVGGATYAALSSQATLTDNTISSVTAHLEVKSGATYSQSEPGFSFTGIVPGGAGAIHTFNLKNTGSTPLALSVAASAPASSPGITDWAKVHVTFDRTDIPSAAVNTTMSALFSGVSLVDPLSNTTNPEATYDVTVTIDTDGVTGETASVGNFNLVFTGTQL